MDGWERDIRQYVIDSGRLSQKGAFRSVYKKARRSGPFVFIFLLEFL